MESPESRLCQNQPVELSWYGRTCIRLRGKDAVVVHDAYQSIVGPTGRGITADISTYSHPDDAPPPKTKGRPSRDGRTMLPGSLEESFVLDGPGEFEVKQVLITGVRTYRDDEKGRQRGHNAAFVTELDGIHTVHLGDIGHLLSEEMLAEIGAIDVACIPIGGSLSATRAAELIAKLGPKIVVPMPVCEDESACEEALAKFFHEMGGTASAPQAKLTITISSLPAETTTVRLESRGKV